MQRAQSHDRHEITALREMRSAIDRVLGSLTPRQALIIRRYYGFEGDGCTYDELADSWASVAVASSRSCPRRSANCAVRGAAGSSTRTSCRTTCRDGSPSRPLDALT